MKDVVAHIKDSFFVNSETFIYHYISRLRSFKPICLSENIENLDKFPFPAADIYCIRDKLFLKTLYCRLRNRTAGLDQKRAFHILKKRKAKLIHAHFGPNGFSSLKLKKLLMVPLVTSFYGYDVSLLAKNKKFQERYRILFRDGELFLVEGEFMRARLIELGCPPKKIAIQRIAIPITMISSIENAVKVKNTKPVFLFCGRFVEKKGLIYALQAFQKTRETGEDFEFRIIGDGPLKSEIIRFIQEKKLGDHIKLLGFLGYNQYLAELSRADIFIHPSVTASDGNSEGGAPTTILEAQAMRKPVISTYHADIPNVVVPGKSALLSEERDIVSLAQNIQFMLKNVSLWKELGDTGRAFVERFHDIDKEVVTLEDKYAALINLK